MHKKINLSSFLIDRNSLSKKNLSFLDVFTMPKGASIYFFNNNIDDFSLIDLSKIKNGSVLFFANLKNKSFLEILDSKHKKLTVHYFFYNCKDVYYLRDFSSESLVFKNKFFFKNSEINLSNFFFDSSLLKFYQDSFFYKDSVVNQNDLSLLSKNQKLLVNIKNNHLYKETISNTTIKNVLKDSSFLRYDGLINILKKADFSKAYLETNNILLSKKATSINVPMLEIVPKNIKATHAATVEHITNDQLFYLGSRGIFRKQAYKIMVSSFLKSKINYYPEKLLNYVSKKINDKL